MRILIERTPTNFAIRNAETMQLIQVRPCINSCGDFVRNRFGALGGFGQHPETGERVRLGFIPDTVSLDDMPVLESISAVWDVTPA